MSGMCQQSCHDNHPTAGNGCQCHCEQGWGEGQWRDLSPDTERPPHGVCQCHGTNCSRELMMADCDGEGYSTLNTVLC